MLLGSSQSTTQNFDTVAVVVREILTHELRSNLAVFLTLSISSVVQTPYFEKMLLSLSQSTTQGLDALAVVIGEISTHELQSNLAFFLALSISTPFVIQMPDSVAKFKVKYHTKFGCPSLCSL